MSKICWWDEKDLCLDHEKKSVEESANRKLLTKGSLMKKKITENGRPELTAVDESWPHAETRRDATNTLRDVTCTHFLRSALLRALALVKV